MGIFVEKLKTLRWVTLILGLLNLGVIFLGGFLMVSDFTTCGGEKMLCLVVIMVVACIRIMSMIGTAVAQESTARMILNEQRNDSSIIVDAVIRHERRMRYKRWLWWTRFGTIITILQFVAATYLMFIMVKYVSYDGKSSGCFLGLDTNVEGWKRTSFVFFLILVWLLAVVQCFTGSDVLRWRSFYETHDNAWKSHYREIFDNGIREFLCCLGRVKYLSVLEEDEVYSVARLLGDLVAYRASGTGHLELLAGLALLQTQRRSANSYERFREAPEELIREAATYHQFAEAAYTGPLLDFGRNPVLFPCVWLYRQGVFTPWTRNRRPILEGDNWWRGHAAAFLKYVDLLPEALRQGRVRQENCEAAYFIVVLHHQRSVVIAVRGTETPEDLITDGLCRESALSMEDLDGLINSDHVAADVKHSVISSFPHYGHSGIVEAARELFIQIDGQPGDKDSQSETGFLSSLLGEGCECHGYDVRIVGHSLGGAVAALLGLRLYQRYPNLHVYAYGTLPCVDSIIGEACSEFVTSIIYNDEFSARLSVNSILRLRAAAITALSHDSSADSAMILKLARRILNVKKCTNSRENERISTASLQASIVSAEDMNHHMYRKKGYASTTKGSGEPSQEFLFQDATSFTENPDNGSMRDGFRIYPEIPNSSFDEFNLLDSMSNCNQPDFYRGTGIIPCGDPVSQFTDGAASSNKVQIRDPLELFLPGLVVHIIPEQKRSFLPLWMSWNVLDREPNYRAFVVNRESFKDMIVSPYMFLDHLPWRCHDAMQRVLETRKDQDHQLYESHMV